MPESEVEKTFPLMKSKDLTDEDKEQYMAILYKSAYSKNMLSEIDFLLDNAKKVQANKIPIHTPIYFFISDGKEVPGTNWRELLSNYVLKIDVGKYKYLDCGHYLHHKKADTIVNEIKAFIRQIKM